MNINFLILVFKSVKMSLQENADVSGSNEQDQDNRRSSAGQAVAKMRTKLDDFKDGIPIGYPAKYICFGPAQDEISEEILKKKESAIPGYLTFSLDRVDFQDENYLTQMDLTMDDIESEKLVNLQKILEIRVVPNKAVSDSNTHYLDVSKFENKNEAVYHPQWVNYAKRQKLS